MCMNKSNLIIALFSFLPILNVIDFGSKPREFIYLLPILLYVVTYVFAAPSNFVVYPLYYILLMHNVLYRAVSHRLLKLHVNRNTLSEKFRLLVFKNQSLFERIFDIQTMMFIRKEEKIL